MKLRALLLGLVLASLASAQTYYEKTTIPPKIAAHTVLGNSTGSTAAPGQLTTIPAAAVPVYSGDCGNAIASSVLVCTQAAGSFNVVGTLSEGVLNPPTTTFAPQEIDFTGTSNSTAAPNVFWNNTTGATNYKAWNCHADSTGSNGNFRCGTQTVNAAGEHDWINVTRGGTNPYDISDVSFGSAGTSNNTTHFLGTGLVSMAGGLTVTGTTTLSTGLALSNLATQATNTVTGNATSGSAVPTALAVGSCSTAGSALNWTTNSGFGCNTAIDAATSTGVTNASAATAGKVGEVMEVHCVVGAAAAAASTITVTIASPAVVTWSSHTFTTTGSPANYTCPINFTTTGALPTGLVVGTNYYIIGSSVSGDTFQLADTAAHALAGTNAVNTSGSQSGTQSAYIGNLGASTSAFAGAAMALTAGDWDCSGLAEFQELTSITSTEFANAIDTSIVVTSIGQSTDIRTVTGSIGAVSYYLPSPIVRRNISTTTNEYFVTKSTFSGGSMNEGARFTCRRMR
jgi:hypothetical protein